MILFRPKNPDSSPTTACGIMECWLMLFFCACIDVTDYSHVLWLRNAEGSKKRPGEPHVCPARRSIFNAQSGKRHSRIVAARYSTRPIFKFISLFAGQPHGFAEKACPTAQVLTRLCCLMRKRNTWFMRFISVQRPFQEWRVSACKLLRQILRLFLSMQQISRNGSSSTSKWCRNLHANASN